MSHTPDFLIQDGILLKYAGQDRVVRVPEGVLGIPTEVFCRSSVEEVLLPDGLEWLGDRAFYRCLRLRRLVLPGSLRIVPPELCSGCSALEEVVIPEGVVGLSENAFVESGLRTVTIPDSVRFVEEYCFGFCRDLKEATLGKRVRILERCAFTCCESLRFISFPDSLTCLEDGVFSDCLRLKHVRMGRGLEYVGATVFARCPLLKKMEFPDSLEYISTDAFGEAPSVRRVTLRGGRTEFLVSLAYRHPDSVRPLTEDDAYEQALAPVVRAPRMFPEWIPASSRTGALAGYEEMKAKGWTLDPAVAEAWEAFAAGADPDSPKKPAADFRIVDGVLCAAACTEGRVAIPDGVVGLRAEVFQGTDILEIRLPDSMEWIQPDSFQGCARLEAVRLPARLTRVPDSLFQDCQSLKSIRIPDTVRRIDSAAFQESGLETIALPPSLEVIDGFAFCGCPRLREVRFPEGLREIRLFAFAGCESLREATLPDSLALLDGNAFSGCPALERVRLGAGLRLLDGSAFSGCSALREVVASAGQLTVRKSFLPTDSAFFRFRMEGAFLALWSANLPLRIVAPNADPAVLGEHNLRSLLLGFVSEDGRGFRCEDRYLDLLRAHKGEFWTSEEILRFLLRHDMLEREEIPDCLEALQTRGMPDLVAEVLEYSHRRFPEPEASLLE